MLSSTPNLRLRLNQYAQIQGMQVAQLAACNRMNGLSEVCASQQHTVPAFIALFFINNYGIPLFWGSLN